MRQGEKQLRDQSVTEASISSLRVEMEETKRKHWEQVQYLLLCSYCTGNTGSSCIVQTPPGRELSSGCWRSRVIRYYTLFTFYLVPYTAYLGLHPA